MGLKGHLIRDLSVLPVQMAHYFMAPTQVWKKYYLKSTDVVEEQEALFWAVNSRVLEVSVAHDFKIDYSLKGIDMDFINKEITAIDAIANGKSREEVADALDGKFPFRMREVEFLITHGYSYTVDSVTQTIHWIKP